MLHLKDTEICMCSLYSAHLAYMKPWVGSRRSRKPGMVVYAVCSETGRSEVQAHLWVYGEFKASLSYIRPIPKMKKRKRYCHWFLLLMMD